MPSLFSKLKLHRDHDHQKLETLKRHQHAKQEGKVASPLDPSMNLTTEMKVSSDATAFSPNLPEQLWNKAYDQLKQKEPKLVDAYEIILSQTLSGDSPGYQPLQHKNSIEQMDSSKRRSQMDLLIQAGLLRTEKEAKLKQSVGVVMQKILSVKEVVSSAVQVMPQAALAWTGVCFTLQIFTNPSTESKANRDGLDHIISRMKWYDELSRLVFGQEINTDRSIAGIYTQLETRVIDLYQELLSYLIKSVCSYHRNRFVNYVRDTLMLDGWDGSLKNVKDAEKAFRQDSSVYNTQKNTINIETLANIAISSEDKNCLRHLRLSDPRDDKKRIEQTKGGLLQDSYRWIFDNADFRQWREDHQSRLLWIKGDPGKGKTMLLCGIANELKKSMARTALLSYFFCQATDSRTNSATAVLRGLMYVLVDQRLSLVSHIRKKYDHAGETLFEDANAWVALSEIFEDILQDPSLNNIYLMIDALDECEADLSKLLNFIVHKSSLSSRVKWIVSSRNRPDIEESIQRTKHKVRLSLELNADSISTAVNIYIRHKLGELAHLKKYDDKTRFAVLNHLCSNAKETFLWVALVCQNLEKIPRWNALAKLNTFPPGLDSLYRRMMEQICNSDTAELCKKVLASIAIVYRPITLKELTSFVELPEGVSDDPESLSEIVGLCGSFLTIREDTIYFVHQSARDYFYTSASNEVFPSGNREAHYTMFSRSLQVMSKTLRRDIYGLRAFGFPIDQVKQPDPDPLAASQYSCVYWVDHLCDWNSNLSADYSVDLQDGGTINIFLKEKYLYWLEALSLCGSMSQGVVSMAKLESLIRRIPGAVALIQLVRDARRFIMYHKRAIEDSPLQTYASALLFSPVGSLIRRLYKDVEPKWITIKPGMEENWSACLQTFEGHSNAILSVAFSHDSTRLASASRDSTVKIWNAGSGECLQTLKGHSDLIHSVCFSHDSTRLVSASSDSTVKFWKADSGECLRTLEDHNNFVFSIFFLHDSVRLASASRDNRIKIWNADSGECLQTLEGHSNSIHSVVFSHDSTRLASTSGDNTVKIWNAGNGKCLQTFKGHNDYIRSIALSYDSIRLASASHDSIIKIWNIDSGECLQTLEGHNDWICSITFSFDSTRLASTSGDSTIKIWDISSGKCLQTFKGHGGAIDSVIFSHDSTQLASGARDNTVKIWDIDNGEYLPTFESHSASILSVVFSHDSTRLASASWDNTTKIWDTSSGKCLQTFKGHNDIIDSIVFTRKSTRLASASLDSTIKIWDINSGECLQTLEGHSNLTHSNAFSHDSIRLASASRDSTVKIWNADSGECLRTLEGYSDLTDSVAFSHDLTQLASASLNHDTIKIRNTDSGKCLQTLKGHTSSIFSIVFSYNSTRLASASSDSTIKIWDTSSGECLRTLEHHRNRIICSIAFSHNSTRLAGASNDNTVKIWDTGSGKCLRTLEGHSDWICSIAFSYNLIWLASTSRDSTVKIWDADSGECLQTLKGHSASIHSVAFSYDSTRLASTCDSTVEIWDTSSGKCLYTLEGHSDWVYSIAFLYDSTRLASASRDGTIKFWDINSGECLQTLKGHSGSIHSIAFSYNSIRLASVSRDSTINIWNTDSGECLQTLKGHSDIVFSIAFSYDLTRLASTSCDSTVKIWDANSGECLQTLEDDSASIVFSHDSARLASASRDSTINIWNIDNGECLWTLKGHSNFIHSVAFSHDSTRLASTSGDNTVKIWDAGNGECLQTLDISRPLSYISFDTTGSYLHTEIGTIAVDGSSASRITQNKMGPQTPWYQEVALSSDGAWITYDSKNLVWLPTEYRGRLAISQRTVGIGDSTGRVCIYNLDFNAL